MPFISTVLVGNGELVRNEKTQQTETILYSCISHHGKISIERMLGYEVRTIVCLRTGPNGIPLVRPFVIWGSGILYLRRRVISGYRGNFF